MIDLFIEPRRGVVPQTTIYQYLRFNRTTCQDLQFLCEYSNNTPFIGVSYKIYYFSEKTQHYSNSKLKPS
jgi:hypothetical protein